MEWEILSSSDARQRERRKEKKKSRRRGSGRDGGERANKTRKERREERRKKMYFHPNLLLLSFPSVSPAISRSPIPARLTARKKKEDAGERGQHK